ncbi:MAG: LysE family transporter [Deltaproteobacteria bacterium]|nr:LysE family transporter [Deltaproteobacteria bacterium]
MDIVYCMAAVAGLGAVFHNRPWLEEAFLGMGGCVLMVFGLYTARTRPLEDDPSSDRTNVHARGLLASVTVGILISVANPALVISWVLLAGTVLSGYSTLESLLAGLGVFLGVFGWFCTIGWLAHKGRVKLGARAVWIPRIAGVLLVAYGAYPKSTVKSASETVDTSALARQQADLGAGVLDVRRAPNW